MLLLHLNSDAAMYDFEEYTSQYDSNFVQKLYVITNRINVTTYFYSISTM